NVTINEPFFQGHFPGHPIMPGVLIIEAMAQVGGMLLMGYFEGQNVEDKVVYFMSLDNVKFRRPVVPGDQIRFELEMLQFRGKIGAGVRIGYGSVLGNDPQDLKYRGEDTWVEVGDGTVIREYCTINRGTSATGKTAVGQRCFLMSYVHLAHDCYIGNDVIIANA